MKIHVDFLGPLRRPSGDRNLELELAEAGTVEELLTQIGYEEHERRLITVVLNGKKASRSTRLTQNDRLTLLLAVGGG